VKFALRLVVIVLVVVLLVVASFGYLATRATPTDVPPLAANEQEITLEASDGAAIAASFMPSASEEAGLEKGAPVILLLHGNGASRNQFRSHVAWLNEAGFHAMALDFRGHGESAEEAKSFGWNEALDAAAAVEWIKANYPQSKVGVIGVSLGGAAALTGENGPLKADAMIMQAVFPDFDRAVRNRVRLVGGEALSTVLTPLLTVQSYPLFGIAHDQISPVRSAAEFTGPVLVISSTADQFIPVSEAEELGAAFPGRQWLWLINGLGHGGISGLDDAAYRERVLTFFREELD